MEKIKVSVTFSKDVYYAYSNGGKFQLCSFTESRSDDNALWTFNSCGFNGEFRTHITAPEFPLGFFKNYCRSIWFIVFGVGELPEVELTGEAKKTLKIK